MKGFVFDAYGTLFDINSVVEACKHITQDPEGFSKLWRAKQLEYTFLRSLMEKYKDFWEVTEDALIFAINSFGINASQIERKKLIETYLYLKPFVEVEDALEHLKNHELAVLSNGSPMMLNTLLENNGLKHYFRHILSADEVRTYKPSPKVYALVPKYLGIPKEEIFFVSSNSFDVVGAKAFGFKVCWINRSGTQLDELGMKPDVIAKTLEGMIGALGL
ncbi:MAG: haloacid dehalogenase, type II, 2-haloacid dehalogenase [Candidatus Dadabacteria bacterium CSP1-2]|nr:MAG: haloacid dehalogenase, type II, 2-haloacid dehalogenase [Candidatus Dadabacteria bacterium CSP1-2]